MMGTLHAAHISASVYETDSILKMIATSIGIRSFLSIEIKLWKWWVLRKDTTDR